MNLNKLSVTSGYFHVHLSGLNTPAPDICNMKLNTCANNAGKINKLVTVFAFAPAPGQFSRAYTAIALWFANSFVTGDKFLAPIILVPRNYSNSTFFVP